MLLKGKIVEVGADKDGVLEGKGIGIVIALVACLGIIAGIAQLERAAVGHDVGEREGDETTHADTALVDIVVGADARVGATAIPYIEDAVVGAVDFHLIFLNLGIVEVKAYVAFDLPIVVDRETFGKGDVDIDAVFEAIHATGDIAVAVGKDGSLRAVVDMESAGGCELRIVEASQPAPTMFIAIAEAEADLVAEFVVHIGVIGELHFGIIAYAAEVATVDKAFPDLAAIGVAKKDTFDSVGVFGAARIEIGLFGTGDEQAGIDEHLETRAVVDGIGHIRFGGRGNSYRRWTGPKVGLAVRGQTEKRTEAIIGTTSVGLIIGGHFGVERQ